MAEGLRCVEELADSPLRIDAALATAELRRSERGEALLRRLQDRGVPVTEVGDREFAGAADTETPQGVLAIAAIPAHSLDQLDLAPTARLAILDGIQDPGNVGTILRTAAALGAAATIALPGTVDLWNAKVVRSAMGALFRRPAFPSTWDAVDAFRDRQAIALWGADAHGEPVSRTNDLPERLALVLGNEGGGLGAEAAARLDRRIAIPLAAGIDSLNVAVAAGILLYELRA